MTLPGSSDEDFDETTSVDIKTGIYVPPVLAFFFDRRGGTPEERIDCFGRPTPFYRYKVAFGGRGSGKSFCVAQALIIRASQERIRVLCAREFQTSIKESSKQILVEQIEALGLEHIFQCRRDEIECIETGSMFLFAGLHHNVSSLKSMTSLDVCWVEEADTVSEDSWSKLIPTIRAPGSEIWVTFNPNQESDPTYQRFVPGQPMFDPERTKSVQVSWRDIRQVLPDVLKAELEHLRRVDPDAYQHVWEGGTWSRSEAQVFNGKWIIENFAPITGDRTAVKNWNGPYFGADWGFSQDPTAMTKSWVHGKRLYIEYEAYGIGVDIVDTPALFDKVPDSRRYVIRADCARPETINHMRRAGFRTEPCAKWTGCVEDGIAYLRSFDKIIVHPRCRHTIEEFRLYSYKTDKLTNDIRPELKPGSDHCIDALRYSLGPLVKHVPAIQRDSISDESRWGA
jgi:phage terminase large subunit